MAGWSNQYVDVLRTDGAMVRRILQALDERDARDESAARRESPRYRYPGHPILHAVITYPTGDIGQYQVVTRDLSRTGLGFLHGKFVYPGSQCELILINHDGGKRSVPATVTRCALVKGRVHEVGVRFESPIDLEEYLLTDFEGVETSSADDGENPGDPPGETASESVDA